MQQPWRNRGEFPSSNSWQIFYVLNQIQKLHQASFANSYSSSQNLDFVLDKLKVLAMSINSKIEGAFELQYTNKQSSSFRFFFKYVFFLDEKKTKEDIWRGKKFGPRRKKQNVFWALLYFLRIDKCLYKYLSVSFYYHSTYYIYLDNGPSQTM